MEYLNIMKPLSKIAANSRTIQPSTDLFKHNPCIEMIAQSRKKFCNASCKSCLVLRFRRIRASPTSTVSTRSALFLMSADALEAHNITGLTFTDVGSAPKLHKEQLEFDYVALSQRSYK